mmetsp:Transcript_21229/g.68729  ORF Transcript_21229/g.68729 Transcript_21229/m.68729 type:complete len:105 (+) Transcript_21229:714-1028(+)
MRWRSRRMRTSWESRPEKVACASPAHERYGALNDARAETSRGSAARRTGPSEHEEENAQKVEERAEARQLRTPGLAAATTFVRQVDAARRSGRASAWAPDAVHE